MIRKPLPGSRDTVATKHARTKSRSRAAKTVSVRDLAPKKRKGGVKGGTEHAAVWFSKMDTGFKPR